MEANIRFISILLGFSWIFVYLLILVARSKCIIGIAAAVAFIALGIYYLVDSRPLDCAVAIVLGISIVIIVFKRPRMWDRFSLI